MPRRRALLAQGKDSSMTPVNAFIPPTIKDEFNVPQPSTYHHHPSLPAIAFAQLGSSNLDGIESRDLALSSLSNFSYPPQIMSLIASSDIYQTSTSDNVDHYQEDYLKSFTSRTYNPGRMYVMGDAAFTVCCNTVGSHGISMALNDALTMAKLYSLYHNSGETNSSKILEQISVMFDTKRLEQRYECLSLARKEAKYTYKEPSWISSYFGVGGDGSSWLATSFEDFLDRGGPILD